MMPRSLSHNKLFHIKFYFCFNFYNLIYYFIQIKDFSFNWGWIQGCCQIDSRVSRLSEIIPNFISLQINFKKLNWAGFNQTKQPQFLFKITFSKESPLNWTYPCISTYTGLTQLIVVNLYSSWEFRIFWFQVLAYFEVVLLPDHLIRQFQSDYCSFQLSFDPTSFLQVIQNKILE